MLLLYWSSNTHYVCARAPSPRCGWCAVGAVYKSKHPAEGRQESGVRGRVSGVRNEETADDYGDDHGLRGRISQSSTVIVAVVVHRKGQDNEGRFKITDLRLQI